MRHLALRRVREPVGEFLESSTIQRSDISARPHRALASPSERRGRMASGNEAVAESAVERMSPLQRVKAILGGSAGNLVEWYAWLAYSSFSLYIAKVFFPKGEQTAQLLQPAAIIA